MQRAGKSMVVVAAFALLASATNGMAQSSPVIEIIARSGESAPGTASAIFDSVSPPVLNDRGDIAFRGRLRGPAVCEEDQWGIWLHEAGRVSLVVRQGDPAPGIEGARFGPLPTAGPGTTGIGRFYLSNQGQIAFESYFLLGPTPSIGDAAIWQGRPGDLELVVQQRSGVLPGLEGRVFSLNANALQTENGMLFFEATLYGEEVASEENSGIWVVRAGRPRVVVRAGDPAPGSERTCFIGAQSLSSNPFSADSIASSGKVAIRAMVSSIGPGSGRREGIWAGSLNDLDLVALQDASVPESDQFFTGFGVASTNNAGWVTFVASFAPRPGGFLFPSGVWRWRNGVLETVAKLDQEVSDEPDQLFWQFGRPLLVGDGSVVVTATTHQRDDFSRFRSGVWVGDPGNLRSIMRSGAPAPGVPGAVFADSQPHPTGIELAVNSSGTVVFSAALAGPMIDRDRADGLWMTDHQQRPVLVVREGQSINVAQPGDPTDTRRVASLEFVGGSGADDGRVCGLNERGDAVFYLRFDDGSTAIARARLRGPRTHDLDGDGVVGAADLALLLGAWGRSAPGLPGPIGARDLAGLLSAWDG